MEEKLAKVRADIEKLNAQLLRGACSSQIAMETRCKEEAYNEVLAILDTMQEEPVSIWHDASEEPDKGREVLVSYDNYNTQVCIYNSYKGFFNPLTGAFYPKECSKWAYIDVLLKL